MSKKELRKELELSLIKVLEDFLNTQNKEATKKIRKTTHAASKMITKKFLKTLKPAKKNNIVTAKKVVKTSIPIKKVIKNSTPIKKVIATKPSPPLPKGKKNNQNK